MSDNSDSDIEAQEAAISRWLPAGQDDWKWDGETLTVYLSTGKVDTYSYDTLVARGVFGRRPLR